MKKFSGKVNGVEYTDREKFEEAVREAVKNGGNLSITSEEYESDRCEECPCMKQDRKIEVKDDEYRIGRHTDRLEYADGSYEYVIGGGLASRLEECSNKDKVRGNAEGEIVSAKQRSDAISERVSCLEDEIGELDRKRDELSKELESVKDERELADASVKYYRGILDILDGKSGRIRLKRREAYPMLGGSVFDGIIDEVEWPFSMSDFLRRTGFLY